MDTETGCSLTLAKKWARMFDVTQLRAEAPFRRSHAAKSIRRLRSVDGRHLDAEITKFPKYNFPPSLGNAAMRRFGAHMRLVRWVKIRGKRLVRIAGVKRSREEDHSVAVPFDYQPKMNSAPFRLAAVCHIYFVELAAVMLDELLRIPFSCDLYISTNTNEKKIYLELLFSNWRGGLVESVSSKTEVAISAKNSDF